MHSAHDQNITLRVEEEEEEEGRRKKKKMFMMMMIHMNLCTPDSHIFASIIHTWHFIYIHACIHAHSCKN
jgi:hypothetical protein